MQHILVTGVSSGLGAALTRQHAKADGRLSLFDRDGAKLAAVAEACRSSAAQVETFTCDVTDAAPMASALVEIGARSRVDLVIANAGFGGKDVLAPSFGSRSAKWIVCGQSD